MANREEKRVAILALSAQGQNPSEISKNLRVSRQTVYRTLERGTATAPKRMRTKPGRPTETVEAVKIAINEKNAKATVRGLAREFNMPRTTMRRLVKDDLGLKSFKRTPRHALKSTDKEKRVAGAKKVVILHLDETPFSLGEMVTMDTGFYIAEACGDADDTTVHYGKERHFANLQVIAVVGSDGQKCDLIFLEDGQRLNSFTYVEFFEKKSLPVGKSNIWRIM
ncbi:Uncharacterized protein FKW44_021769, partial [Caligus rogercresseyi]